MRNQDQAILVAGATGYVGSRLRVALERRGLRVRCLARRPEALVGRVGERTEIVAGDCLDPASLAPSLAGVETAFYLVHSMGATRDFVELDRAAARNFGEAAREAGVRRIVYLGGLGRGEDALSPHLRSRQETGEILRRSGLPVVELRASIVIGSGSLSYEMVRALVERVPVMLCPSWVRVEAQPIAIEDVIEYLVESLELADEEAGVFEIGGPQAVSYRELMLEYARQRGLRRFLIPVPFLTPRLSSLWLGLVTPLYARVGRKLIDSLRNPTTVRSDRALRTFRVRPRDVREAIGRALALEDAELAATRWSDALSSSALRPASWGGIRLGSRVVDSRAVEVDAPPARAFAPIRTIGGEQGWYWGRALWRLRGAIDLLVGGVGLRRGRPDAERLHVGDPLDFWRVEAYEEPRLLRLAAEMKVPGRAWLQFEVEPLAAGRSEIRQTALFDPAGLLGLVYWYLLYPLHALIFQRMLARIAERASALQAAGLVDTLKGKGPFAVFAPTDEAFAKIPKTDLDALLKDKA
jgi:uncharacterized protein YbjT (DUF2867 family)